MQQSYAEIQQLGGEVVAITFTPPRPAARFLERYPLPFPVVCDLERRAYRALELGSTTPGSFFRPKVLWGYLKLLLRGWLPWQPQEEADLLQLGGDFVVDAQRRVVYAHRSTAATDRPPLRELLEAIRAACGGPR